MHTTTTNVKLANNAKVRNEEKTTNMTVLAFAALMVVFTVLFYLV